jgi:hypothetical protein
MNFFSALGAPMRVPPNACDACLSRSHFGTSSGRDCPKAPSYSRARCEMLTSVLRRLASGQSESMRTADQAPPQSFWGEIAPCDHFVQIYEDELAFVDVLGGFVTGGLLAGEAIIIIATPAHRQALEQRLQAAGIDVPAARAVDSYISLDAGETLDRFMVDDWPDEERFKETVSGLLSRAGAQGRRVRAFGEMVALLWAQGHCGATVRLEYLWNRFCEQEGFSLLCAYPKSGFTADAADSIRQICDAHSHVVDRTGTRTRGESSLKELTKRLNPLT